MNELTKRDFLVLFNSCNHIGQKIHNKLGLFCANFCRKYAYIFEKLSTEEKEIDAIPEIVSGKGVVEKSELLLKWKSELLGINLDKHTVYIPNEKDLGYFIVAPDLYLTLNGFIFELSEEDYLAALEAEIIVQNKSK